MRITVLPFALLRELLGRSERCLDLPDGARLEDAWAGLVAAQPALRSCSATIRFARNGVLADGNELLADGDELALLPPVGGG